MENSKELKKAILASLAEKGDFATILKHLSSEEKEEKSEKLTKLITPISAFADILTENSKGAFMEDLTSRLDETTKNGLTELTKSIETAKKELQVELKSLLSSTKDSLTTEHLERYKQAEEKLQTAMMQMCVEIVSAKADEILPTLSEQAKLTDDEIEEIIYQSALSVESQMTDIVGDYVSTASFTVSQIADFRDKVIELIPQVDPSKFSIDWSQVRNTPSVGGTNANLVKQIVDEAIANIESLPDQTGNSGKFLTTDGTTASWGTPAGSGNVSNTGTPVNNQVAVWTDATTIEGDTAFTFDTTTDILTVGGIVKTPILQANTSAGVIVESANGTDVGLLGAGNTANVTWYGAHNFDTATQDTIAAFTGAGKTLGSLALATYPSLTELSYVKGATSSIQDQIDAITGASGITRSVVVTSGSATMGSTAATDYVYLVAGAHTMTLPTAVSNTNRYTVKNNHSAAITVDTTSAQTIDGTTTISINPQSSVDIISNNSNWFII